MSIWVKLALLSALILGAVGWHQIDKQMALRALEQSLTASYQARVVLESLKAKEVETTLLNSTLEATREKNEIITKLNADLAIAINELHSRPKRPISNTTTSDTGKTCTGSELYREDAEFLTRESYRAEQLIKERDYYYEQYEQARLALQAHSGSASR